MGTSRWSPLLLLAALIFALSAAGHAQSTYRLTHIIPRAGIEIRDMNETGDLVGMRLDPIVSTRAVLVRDGELIDLGGDLGSSAVAINDRTQIVGFDPGLRSFFWENGQMRAIEVADAVADANDINNRGQVVGFSTRGPFLWEQGRTTILQPAICPPSPATGFGNARALNENGVVVGTSPFLVAGNPNVVARAVIWQDGEVMALEPPFPMDLGEAVGVNDRNEVIGIYSNACCTAPVMGNHCCLSPTPGHVGFLWQPDGEVTVLPALDRSPVPQRVPLRVFLLSINNASQVVGFTTLMDTETNEEQESRATLWQDGAVHDLNELVREDDPNKPFVTLLLGIRITDSGLILALGEDSRDAELDYFFLTPDGSLPAPAASPPPSPSSTSPSSSDSGGGAINVLALLFLMFGLTACYSTRCAR